MQRFGRILRANGVVRACECAEALGKGSASPFQLIQQRPYFSFDQAPLWLCPTKPLSEAIEILSD